MNNRGSVSIFLCLMIIAITILGISGIKVVEHHMAKSKGAMTTKSAMSGVNADYNSYIFENYHILLFDKNCNGLGEAYLEEKLIKDIGYNLGDGFVVEDVIVADYVHILEDDCQEFKNQIADYTKYAMVEYGADSILQSTGGKDGTVADYILEDMEASSSNAEEMKPEEDAEEFENPWADVEDPRDSTKILSSDMILSMVVPEDMEVSNVQIDLSKTPSRENVGYGVKEYLVDNDFDDLDVFKDDIDVYDSWKNSLVEGGAGLAYAAAVYNCATETVQEDTVFDFELEYIVSGKPSDKDNLKSVVSKIIGIRLPVNYAYLVTDVVKMSEISKISWPLSFAVFVPEPVLRYLIAGCWAYVESIVDVRCLLDGQKLEFFKSAATWKTDLNDLENSVNLDSEGNDTGLTYKDYLLILLSFDMKGGYYRMLDVIELNTSHYYKEFDMNNGVVGFTVDTTISYKGSEFYYRESIGY